MSRPAYVLGLAIPTDPPCTCGHCDHCLGLKAKAAPRPSLRDWLNMAVHEAVRTELGHDLNADQRALVRSFAIAIEDAEPEPA